MWIRTGNLGVWVKARKPGRHDGLRKQKRLAGIVRTVLYERPENKYFGLVSCMASVQPFNSATIG